jgi:glycosyltransferase involved in cell wall biosynthesis
VKKKYLILISASFPYGLKEPFLETELKHHALHFDKIYLLVPKIPKDQSHHFNFQLPQNVIVAQFLYTIGFWERLKGLRFLFSFVFWRELSIIRNNYHLKINRNILKTLLSTLIRADHFAIQVKKFLKVNRIPFHRTTCYTYWCNEYSLGIANLRRKYKIAGAFSRVHNWDLYFERAPSHYLPLRSTIFKRLDAVFPVSEQTKQYILKKIPNTNPDKLIVSYLGVEKIGSYRPENKGKTLKILSLAFLGKIKRIDLLIAALETLEGFDVEWHHIGKGNDHLDIKQYAFNSLFNKANIKYVLTGDITKKEVYEYLHKNHFDVLINTSSYEGVPVSMMEALSFSIPIIGTNVGGVAEIIDDENNGYLLSVDPEPLEIVEKLQKLYRLSEPDYEAMRQHAYQTWETKFNAENNYSELIYNMVQLSKNYEN